MKKQKEITISGVGGQGMILCGSLIARAAAIHDRKRATLSSEYGVETRGTFAKSDVIVSEEEIYFPDVTEPDLIICLHQVSYDRYSGKCSEGAHIIYNEDEVTPNPKHQAKETGIAITRLSKEIGHPAVANIVTMGITVGCLDLVSQAGAESALSDFFQTKGRDLIELNHRAFRTGYEIGKQLSN